MAFAQFRQAFSQLCFHHFSFSRSRISVGFSSLAPVGGFFGGVSSCFFSLPWKPLMVLIIRNTAKAMMRKSESWPKLPYLMATSVAGIDHPVGSGDSGLQYDLPVEKSTPPVSTEIRGMMTSFTKVEILPNAHADDDADGHIITLPRAIKVLNSP